MTLLLATAVLPFFFWTGSDTFRLPKTLLFVAFSAFLWAFLGIEGVERLPWKNFRHPLAWCGGWLAGVYLVSGLLAGAGFNVVHDLILLLGGAGFFLAAEQAVTTPQRERLLLGTAGLAGTVSAVYGVLQYLGEDPIFNRRERHFIENWATAGFVGQPTLFAAFIGVIIPVTLFGIVASRSWLGRLACVVASGSMILVVFLTHTRAVVFGVPIACLLSLGVFAATREQGRRLVLGLLGATVVVMAGLFSVFYTQFPTFQRKLLETLEYGTSATYRIFFWKVAAEMGFDHPLLGIGPGGFRFHGLDYRCRVIESGTTLAVDQATPLQAHSEYLQTFAEVGLLGMFGWFWTGMVLLVLFWRYLLAEPDWREALQTTALVAGLVVIVLNCFVSFPFHIVPSAAYALIFAGLLMRRVRS